MKNVAGEQGLALQQPLPCANLLTFFINSNCHKISFFDSRGLKLAHYAIFYMLFPYLTVFKLYFLSICRPHDGMYT